MTIFEPLPAGSDHCPKARSRGSRAMICLLAWLTVARAGVAPAADPPAAPRKPDWAALDSLLVAGDFVRAVTAADEIVELVRPKPRAPDFLPRSSELARALMRRGVAELRLGRLDAAEATFAEAHRTFKNKDFQRLLTLESRQATAAMMPKIILLELDWLDLLNLRMTVLVERIRAANLRKTAADDDGPLREEVDRWLAELEIRKKQAAEAREALAGRLDKGGTAILSSPYFRQLVGPFRPELVDGVTSLELARLAARPEAAGSGATPAVAAPAPAASRRDLLVAATDHFRAAASALDEAVAAAQPAKATGLKPDQRLEAALLEAELLTNRAAAWLEAGAPDRARLDLERVLELSLEIGTLRKRPDPREHPDRFWPLLLLAETILAGSQRQLADGDAEAARAAAKQAADLLAAAAALPVPNDHPLRGKLAELEARIGRQQVDLGSSVPRSDAANAAARGQQRALDATALGGIAD